MHRQNEKNFYISDRNIKWNVLDLWLKARSMRLFAQNSWLTARNS